MVQFASYLRRVLCETRLIFSRINGPNVIYFSWEHCYAQEKSRTKVIQCPVKDAIGGGGGGGFTIMFYHSHWDGRKSNV